LEDILAVARVLIALAFYITAYILPPALVLGALIRLALRWHTDWRLMLATLLAALWRAYFIATDNQQNVESFSGVALTLIAAILYFMGSRGHRGGIKLLLDIALFVGVLVYMVMNVSWVVG